MMSTPTCCTHGAVAPTGPRRNVGWPARDGNCAYGRRRVFGFSPVVIASNVPRTARRDTGTGGAVIEVVGVPEDAVPARVAGLADVPEGRGRSATRLL
jgi:hypothetical protein